jgi:hypothetical protein
VEIEEALERAHDWLRNQSWWSDERDAIISVQRADGSWVVGHTIRELVATGEYPIGGYGPVVITDDGGIIPAETCVSELPLDIVERFNLTLARALQPRDDES